MPPQKILIVEDEPALANALELELKEAGYEVKKAANGQIGLDLIPQFKPELVILDLLMPVMNGVSMLHQLRSIPNYKYCPVIILTNAGEADNMTRTVVYENADVFLIKANTSPAEIVSKVKELI